MKIKLGIVCLMLTFQVFAKSYLDDIFQVKKPIIAALFLDLPEDLNSDSQIQEIADWGISQVEILERQNVDSILWEYGYGGIKSPSISKKELDVMVDIINRINAKTTKLVVGVEILWHYPFATLELAKRTGAKFVRLDFFSDPMLASGVAVPIESEKIIQYKNMIGAQNLILLTDIQVKYAEMINTQTTMEESAIKAISKNSNAVVVSGRKSGQPPAVSKVKAAKVGAGSFDVVMGSGTNYLNIVDFFEFADGAIVGTSISQQTGGPLEEWKVKRYMQTVFKIRNSL